MQKFSSRSKENIEFIFVNKGSRSKKSIGVKETNSDCYAEVWWFHIYKGSDKNLRHLIFREQSGNIKVGAYSQTSEVEFGILSLSQQKNSKTEKESPPNNFLFLYRKFLHTTETCTPQSMPTPLKQRLLCRPSCHASEIPLPFRFISKVPFANT